ncbi:RNA polymerase B [Phlyctochytrium bullatum]|nr:RNA polymerase B [Phlyctochytrium bullatum]
MSFRKRTLVEEEDAADLKLGGEFQDVQCLLISEVRVLLEVAKEKRREAGRDNTPDIVQKAADYCQKFSRFNNKQTIKEIRGLFPEDQNFHQFEMAQLANLCCETVEEAKALIPSLAKKFDDHEDARLQDLLDQMANLRRYQTTTM